jgi:hypothetical protein
MAVRQFNNSEPHFGLHIVLIQCELIFERSKCLIEPVHLIVDNAQEHVCSWQLWIELAGSSDGPFGCIQLSFT